MDCDLVLLAMGFTGPVRNGMIEQLGVKLDQRGNVATGENYMSSVPGVFAAGDMRRGQSLVVWAIAEGRKAAAAMDIYLNQPLAKPYPSQKCGATWFRCSRSRVVAARPLPLASVKSTVKRL